MLIKNTDNFFNIGQEEKKKLLNSLNITINIYEKNLKEKEKEELKTYIEFMLVICYLSRNTLEKITYNKETVSFFNKQLESDNEFLYNELMKTKKQLSVRTVEIYLIAIITFIGLVILF